jgi:hypothetical protein
MNRSGDKTDPPPGGGAALDNPANLVGNPTEAPIVFNQRSSWKWRRADLLKDRRCAVGGFSCVRH